MVPTFPVLVDQFCLPCLQWLEATLPLIIFPLSNVSTNRLALLIDSTLILKTLTINNSFEAGLCTEAVRLQSNHINLEHSPVGPLNSPYCNHERLEHPRERAYYLHKI